MVDRSDQTKLTSRAGNFDTENMPLIIVPGNEEDENIFHLVLIIVGEQTPSLDEEQEQAEEEDLDDEE